jgi:subfamily B ATP-binding cassette protein MsbA
MKLNEIILILKRLYQNYVKTHIKRIFFSLILSIIVAGSTASIAWLLDPAIKKVFIEQDKTYAILIPIGIIMAFAGKGLSLFYARINVIKVTKRDV